MKIFGNGDFHGRMPFDAENIRQKWSAMTDEDKKKFVEKQVQFFDEHFSGSEKGYHRCGSFTVENMDRRCEEWLKKSEEEKKAFIQSRKNIFIGIEIIAVLGGINMNNSTFTSTGLCRNTTSNTLHCYKDGTSSGEPNQRSA